MKTPPTAARLSTRVARLHSSPIRDILSVIDRPGMISFAGGLPSAASFPRLSLEAMPMAMLQYGASEGETELRERIAAELAALGLYCGADQVLILSGSQQGIDLVAKLCVDAGTRVAVEAPTYLAALQVFRFFGAHFDTLDPLQADAALSMPDGPALVYVNPTFQNPTGRCYSLEERRGLAQACDAHGVTLFEDDPYRDLAYGECERTPICALLERAPWIYQGSFSKTLAPGLRLGFLAASPDLLPHLIHLKQAADLHSSRISQWLVLEHLRDPHRLERLDRLRASYRTRRDSFAAMLERHLAGAACWGIPPGGLFFWLELHRPRDTRTLLAAAIERGVAFMPGEPFFPNPSDGIGTLRLNFSHTDEADLERGIGTLAELAG